MAPFYGWGSSASRLQSHFKEAVYFLPPFSNISWTTWLKELMEPILDRKFKASLVKIIKFDNYRKIRALGPSFPNCPNTLNTLKQVQLNPQIALAIE